MIFFSLIRFPAKLGENIQHGHTNIHIIAPLDESKRIIVCLSPIYLFTGNGVEGFMGAGHEQG
jgi:hypothetical protein